MTKQDISQFSDTYGNITSDHTYGKSADNFLEDLGQFAELFPSDVIGGAMNAASEFDSKTKGYSSQMRLLPFHLDLEFKDDALSTISLTNVSQGIPHYEGKPIFETDPCELLQHFQTLNGGAKVWETDVLFDKIGLLLTGLYYQNDKSAWRFYRQNDEIFEDRFVTLFAPTEIDRYLTDDFVDVDFMTK